MKIFRKVLLFALVGVISANSFAQTFTVKAGLNMANMVIKDNNNIYSNDFTMKPGVNVGGFVEFGINNVLTFETGLMFSQKGYKRVEFEYDAAIIKEKETTLYTLNYLEIPLNIKFYHKFGSVNAYLQAGPYVGVGLTGNKKKIEENMVIGDQSTETKIVDIKWGSGAPNDFKQFDGGLSFGLGAEMMKIQLGVTYNLGLLSISPLSTNGMAVHNRVLAVSVGYKF